MYKKEKLRIQQLERQIELLKKQDARHEADVQWLYRQWLTKERNIGFDEKEKEKEQSGVLTRSRKVKQNCV